MKRKTRTNKNKKPLLKKWFQKPLQDRRFLLILTLSFLIITGLVVGFTQFGSLVNRLNPEEFRVGQVAERDVIVDRDVIYIDEQATARLRETREKLVYPVFRVREELSKRSISQINRFLESLNSLLERNLPERNIIIELMAAFPNIFTEEELKTLLSYPQLKRVLTESVKIVEILMAQGIVAIPQNGGGLFDLGMLVLSRVKDGVTEHEELPISSIITEATVPQQIEMLYSKENRQFREMLNLITGKFIQPNTFYDSETTKKNREQAREEVSPLSIKLLKGEIILQKGFIVTDEDMKKLEALGAHAATVNINNLLGTLIYLLLIFAVSVYILNPPITAKRLGANRIYFLLSLCGFFLLWSFVTLQVVDGTSTIPVAVFIPTACISMLAAIIINPRVGILFTLLLSFLFFAILDSGSYVNFFFALISGIVATRTVSRAEKRIELIRAGIGVSLINILLVVCLGLFQNNDLRHILYGIIYAGLNGFGCAILNLGLLPFFEHLLNAPTVFRLIELSDTNVPILKKMLTLAPGTYSHSINVANLAESACRDIGANPLIARVGSFYHDIGKIEQAEYFIENQTAGNKHEELQPSLSVAVIKSHVKVGIEKAKELGLPREIIDIISQHHGKGLINYFYAQAIKSGKRTKINPEDYSYTEAYPTSKEAAVIMLADTVEVISRTLKNPTIMKLDKMIGTAIMEKLNAGLLTESEITMKDLEIIKKRFVQILAGQFHTRIEYPDLKKPEKGNTKNEPS